MLNPLWLKRIVVNTVQCLVEAGLLFIRCLRFVGIRGKKMSGKRYLRGLKILPSTLVGKDQAWVISDSMIGLKKSQENQAIVSCVGQLRKELSIGQTKVVLIKGLDRIG